MNAPASTPAVTSPVPEPRIKRLRFWHEAIIDDMLIHPKSPTVERAKRLGYTAGYLGSLMNSDMFKAAYEARRRAFNARLDESITTGLRRIANKQLELLEETIETKRTQIPFLDQVEGTTRVLSALGFGPKPGGPQVVVQNNTAVQSITPQATAEQIASARDSLRKVEQMRVIEASPQATQVPTSSSGTPQVVEGKPEASGE